MIAQVAGLLNGLSFVETVVVVMGGSLVLAVVIEVVGVRAVRRMVGQTSSRLDDILVEELRLPIIVSVVLSGLLVFLWSPATAESVMGVEVTQLPVGKLGLSVIVVVWARSLNRIVNRGVQALETEGRQYEFAPVFSNVWTLVMVTGAAASLLTLWNVEITPLLGAAGIAGIAIGFAAKDTVANFFGGMALYFDDTYKIGDYVVLESGEAGTVVEVGIRSTTILTRAETLVTVPNALLNASKVTNESAPTRRKRIKLPISVAYGTDIDRLESLLLETAADEDLVLEKPVPRARFRNFGESAIEYELLCWVGGPTREGRTRHRLNRDIYRRLGEAGIEIPYPTRDIRVDSPAAQAAESGGDVESQVS